MIHLSDEQIYRLAEATEKMQVYSEDELIHMDHLETCKECYEKFCVMSALLEVTSEGGYMFMAMERERAKKTIVSVPIMNKVLAVVQVIRNRMETTVSKAMEQIMTADAGYQFVPSLAMATRGLNSGSSSVLKIEELNDEHTFIVFDETENELTVQLNMSQAEADALRVYLSFDAHETIEVPLTRKGKLVKGSVTNIPPVDFQIHVERC